MVPSPDGEVPVTSSEPQEASEAQDSPSYHEHSQSEAPDETVKDETEQRDDNVINADNADNSVNTDNTESRTSAKRYKGEYDEELDDLGRVFYVFEI